MHERFRCFDAESESRCPAQIEEQCRAPDGLQREHAIVAAADPAEPGGITDARAQGRERPVEPAEALLVRALKERRRRWEETELARFKATGKTPRDDKWKAKYDEPSALRGEYFDRLSPRQVYRAVSLGIADTGMPSFSQAYNEQQRWDVAFFALTLRFGFMPRRPSAPPVLDITTLAGASNGGSFAGGVITWPAVASLPNGATLTYSVTAIIRGTGSLTNVARSTSVTADPQPGNNRGTATTTIAASATFDPIPKPKTINQSGAGATLGIA